MNEEDKLLKFRSDKDKFWRENPSSPLTEEQKKDFKGLNYFLPNPKFRFVLPLDKNVSDAGSEVEIKTTDGDTQIYLKAGKVSFETSGKKVDAVIFEDPEQEQYQYYLLFRDLTTGKETYENGRMLQIEKEDLPAGRQDDKLVVDFNYAYNPYSVYNDNWGCPITPAKNFLPAEIKAGEKKFQ